MTNLREAVARSISRRVAKREFGESYQGYETSHGAAGNDYADAALAAIEAVGFTVVPREATEDMVEAGMAARQMPGQASGVFGQTIASSWRHEFQYELAIYAAMLDAAPKP